tara:strand:- start:270 stop:593 length:324 start_codon:yes stop_codon:yes gene_type:complete
MNDSYIFSYVTVESLEQAELIAKKLIEDKLAACVNVIPKVSSYYEWQGKVCKDEELILLIKSLEPLFEEIKKTILSLHSYELPSILKLPCLGGHKDYLKWLKEQVSN